MVMTMGLNWGNAKKVLKQVIFSSFSFEFGVKYNCSPVPDTFLPYKYDFHVSFKYRLYSVLLARNTISRIPLLLVSVCTVIDAALISMITYEWRLFLKCLCKSLF